MGILISQSEERREFKKRDFKNVKVILLRDLTNLANRVALDPNSSSNICDVIKHVLFALVRW